MAYPYCERFGCAWGSYAMEKHFYVMIKLAKSSGKCVETEPVYVATEVASVGKILSRQGISMSQQSWKRQRETMSQ